MAKTQPTPFTSGKISQLSKKMEGLGVKTGGSNLPPSDAVSPDLHETKVIIEAQRYAEIEEGLRTDSFVDIEKKISETEQKIESIEYAMNSLLEHDLLEGTFETELAKHDQALVSTCAKEMEARAALNRFKTENKIYGPAHYPPDQLLHFSLLILFIAIETTVNAFFYQGSSGLLGGAVVALAIAVINMGIAASLGATYRYSNLSSKIEKIKGYTALAAFVVFGLVLNLIFSTFRIQYELLQARVISENIAEPTTAMLISAFKIAVFDAFGVFAFQFPEIDVMSFILFFVGLLCSILAFWKGYSYDDRYPGHGQMDRYHKRCESEYEGAKKLAFDSASSKVHQISSEVETSRETLISAQRTSIALKAQAQGAESTFNGNTQKIQGELDLVLQSYRGANRATRAVEAPRYFDSLPRVDLNDELDRLQALLKRIDGLTTRSKEIVDDKVPLLSDRVLQIRGEINKLVQNTYQSYLSQVVRRATSSLTKNGQAQPSELGVQ